MISASLAVEGHAHGLGHPGHHPYMTYPEPWRGAPPPKPAEFLRPAPKPLGTSRYNGSSVSSTLNGTRLVSQSSPRSASKYPSPPSASTPGPVNLIKEESTASSDDVISSAYTAAAAAYTRLYQSGAAPPPFTGIHYQSSLPGPYAGLYPSHYTSMIRTNYVQPPPLSPLETYSPPSTSPGTFVSPPATYTSTSLPPLAAASTQTKSSLREKRLSVPGFKVPSGKEGSLKHRILTRPPGENTHGVISRKRVSSTTLSPPSTPTKSTNNNTVAGNFSKGSLIELANGELRPIEDMRTEDFVLSAEKSPELRLAESTVVRIDENPITGTSTITLSYNQNRQQADFEATLEHPLFVYGQGWASLNPERTLQCYGLKVHRLQVGDIVVSLTPRSPISPSASTSTSSTFKTSTITTTATTTAMTARQISRTTSVASATTTTTVSAAAATTEQQARLDKTLLPPPAAPVPLSARLNHSEPLDVSTKKRRWSAPDQICDDDEQVSFRRHKE